MISTLFKECCRSRKENIFYEISGGIFNILKYFFDTFFFIFLAEAHLFDKESKDHEVNF